MDEDKGFLKMIMSGCCHSHPQSHSAQFVNDPSFQDPVSKKRALGTRMGYCIPVNAHAPIKDGAQENGLNLFSLLRSNVHVLFVVLMTSVMQVHSGLQCEIKFLIGLIVSSPSFLINPTS